MLLACVATPAAAAQPSTAAPVTLASSPSVGLEEIVVTARRRAENLQDTPISITAFTERGLLAMGVQNISQISAFTPNLYFSPTANISGSQSAASIFIRGVGQTDFTLTTEPGVGLYVDGVYIARSVGSVLDLVDIERVEVLRGPQGTLFGKNTIGGAISVTSRAPATTRGGRVEATYGAFNRAEGKLSLDLPLSEKVLAQFTIADLHRDGYAERRVAGDKLGGRDTFAARAAIRFLPREGLTIDVVGDYTRSRDDSAPTTILGVGNPATLGSPVLAILNGTLPPSQQYTYANYATGDPYRTNGTGPNFSDLDIFGISGTVSWQILPHAKLKSITAYRDLDSHFGRDADNSPLLFVHTDDIYKQWQFSEELQLAGTVADDRLSYVIGAYYFKEKGNNINRVALPGAFGAAIGVPGPAFTIHSGGRIDNESFAGFGQATFKLTPKLGITGGVRYTDENKAFLPDQFVEEARAAGIVFAGPGLLLDPLISSRRVSATFRQWSPRASVEYKPTKDILGYFSFSTGFKSGGFVQRIFPGRYTGTPANPMIQTAPSFGPEKVEVYEAGVKLTALDRRVRLNVAGFHTDYRDLQVTLLQGIAPSTQNGGKGSIDGFEAELTAAPADGLELSANLGYTDAGYDRLDPRVFLNPGNQLFLTNRFPNTSKVNASASAAYGFKVAPGAKLTLQGNWSYRSSYYLDAENNALLLQRAYSLFGTSLTLDLDSGLSLQLVGRNLADKRYLTGGNVDLSGLGYAEGTYAIPREWSITARYRF